MTIQFPNENQKRYTDRHTNCNMEIQDEQTSYVTPPGDPDPSVMG